MLPLGNNIVTEESTKLLLAALALSWDRRTSYRGMGAPTLPDYQQCIPTALVVHNYFGGLILAAKLRDSFNRGIITHYWNKVEVPGASPLMQPLDLTRGQLEHMGLSRDPNEGRVVNRSVLISNPSVFKMYETLFNRVIDWMDILTKRREYLKFLQAYGYESSTQWRKELEEKLRTMPLDLDRPRGSDWSSALEEK